MRAAEQRLQAAGESLVAAKAARYPQLTLGLLAGIEQGVKRLANLGEATAAATRAIDLARQQHAAGTVSMLEVLDAERSLFEVQRSQAQAKVDVALRWVEINRALGNAPTQAAFEVEGQPQTEKS